MDSVQSSLLDENKIPLHCLPSHIIFIPYQRLISTEQLNFLLPFFEEINNIAEIKRYIAGFYFPLAESKYVFHTSKHTHTHTIIM